MSVSEESGKAAEAPLMSARSVSFAPDVVDSLHGAPRAPVDPTAPHPLERTFTDVIVASYDGERDAEGRLCGSGTATFIGGSKYEGGFCNGRMHGKGTFTWTDGTVYTGEFEHGDATGSGTFNWTDGSSYKGEVVKGMRHGVGVFVCPGPSGAVYDGEWENGLRHGTGSLKYGDDEGSMYVGQWKDGMRHGEGTITYPSGNAYTGEWEKDVKCGKGVFRWTTTNEVYDGEWEDDKPHGLGVHTWLESAPEEHGRLQKQMCNRYEGDFVAGKRHGNGAFFYANGSSYVGEWVENVKSGHGTFTFSDGHIYEGPFENDRMANLRTWGKRSPDDAAIALHIEDLLRDERPADAEREVSETNKVLLRWISDLKHVYQYYCTLGPTDRSSDLFTMSRAQLWAFVKDVGALSPSVTLASVDRMLTTIRKRSADAKLANSEGKRGETSVGKVASLAAHDGSNPVLFREFLEGIVRIAHTKYNSDIDPPPFPPKEEPVSPVKAATAPLSTSPNRNREPATPITSSATITSEPPMPSPMATSEYSLSWLTDCFLFHFVRPRAGKPDSAPVSVLANPDAACAVAGYEEKISAAFVEYAKSDPCASGDPSKAAKDSTMSAREFCTFLQDKGCIGFGFTLADAMRVFASTVYSNIEDVEDAVDDTVGHFGAEMLHSEFFEAVARLGDAAFQASLKYIAEAGDREEARREAEAAHAADYARKLREYEEGPKTPANAASPRGEEVVAEDPKGKKGKGKAPPPKKAPAKSAPKKGAVPDAEAPPRPPMLAMEPLPPLPEPSRFVTIAARATDETPLAERITAMFDQALFPAPGAGFSMSLDISAATGGGGGGGGGAGAGEGDVEDGKAAD